MSSLPALKRHGCRTAVAIFDVIAGCDPADRVTAASQGKRADSYLRFLDKDGARLGVVHQLFTSEDADPDAMARIGPPPRCGSRPRRSNSLSAIGCTDGFSIPAASARLADPSIQHRRVARAAEIGKHWPELPVARKRAVLTALIERPQ